MSKRLVLEVPDVAQVVLASAAARSGRSAEELASEWLTAAALRVRDDPLEAFIGAFNSDVADAAAEHDRYLADGLEGELLSLTAPAPKGGHCRGRRS